jgi:hypothetical protein
MTGQIRERTKFAGDVCRAVDAQTLLLGQCADAALGKRKPVADDRVTAADAPWRDVLATRYVFAAEDLQRAMSGFDRAREPPLRSGRPHPGARVQPEGRSHSCPPTPGASKPPRRCGG